MKTMLFVSAGYPSPARPTMFAFLQEIVHAFARRGFKCIVVNPTPFYLAWNRDIFPFMSNEKADGAKYEIDVYRPMFLSTRNLSFPRWGVLNPGRLRHFFFRRRVLSLLKEIGIKPDVVYGHFVFDGGVAAMDVGAHYDIPVLVGVGEENLYTSAKGVVTNRVARKCREQVACYFPNSFQLARALKDILNIDENRMMVLPNGVDHEKFRPLDKLMCRRKLNVPPNAFVVGSIGDFIHRKGVNRVAAAIEGMDNVVGIFAGREGDSSPRGHNVLIARAFNHDDLPMFLSACDVFVLPTLSEGCCNAIIEAEACGLPIITSNLECVSELIDGSCGICVDPMDIKSIASAIWNLRNNQCLRESLSKGSLERSQRYDINKRISNMITRVGII